MTAITYPHVHVASTAPPARADHHHPGPDAACRAICAASTTAGAAFWPLAMARELDDALLHLRLNEPAIGLLVFCGPRAIPPRCWPPTRCWRRTRTTGWCAKSGCYLKRVLKRVDMMARSLIALIEPGSCFAGTLAEIVFAADRSVMFAGARGRRQSRSGHAASVRI